MLARVRDGITPEMREQDGYHKEICPRCDEWEIGFPAISRADDTTLVCSQCGAAEAMEQVFTHGKLRYSWLLTGEPIMELPEVDEFLAMTDAKEDD